MIRNYQLRERVAYCWVSKMCGTTVGMTLFFIAYFWVLSHPVYPVTVMPLTIVDDWIDFQPAALPLYLSLWIYVSLAPALLLDRRELISYGIAAGVLSLIGLGIFYRWPTMVPIPDINWLDHPSVSFLKNVDASGNACPSLHVAFAVFTALWFQRILRGMRAIPALHWLNWTWCLGIIYSTVAIRQHVAWDVVGGIALGLLVVIAHIAWLNRTATRC